MCATFLEILPPAQRPTHFAYYPSWLGTGEFFDEVLFHTSLRAAVEPRRLVGDGDMQVIVANWDHVGTGELPLEPHPGWAMVDRIDIADLASERAHHWRGELGRRATGDPTAKWSFVGRETGAHGLVLDGGRTIRGGREQLAITIDRTKPVRLVLRTGGQASHPFQDTLGKPVTLRVLDDGDHELASITIPAPAGSFVELPIALPAGSSTTIRTEATGPYRAFHWFVLQPE